MSVKACTVKSAFLSATLINTLACSRIIQSPMEACATRVSVNADCTWCEQTSPSIYGIGFHVDNISEEAQRVLESCAD